MRTIGDAEGCRQKKSLIRRSMSTFDATLAAGRRSSVTTAAKDASCSAGDGIGFNRAAATARVATTAPKRTTGTSVQGTRFARAAKPNAARTRISAASGISTGEMDDSGDTKQPAVVNEAMSRGI